jgi:predicted nucleic acid-binding protein
MARQMLLSFIVSCVTQNNFILDSSFLNSLFSAEDSNHSLALDLYDSFADGKVFMAPTVVKVELLQGVHADKLNADIFVFLEQELKIKWIGVDERIVEICSGLLLDERVKLKTIDLIILATTQLKIGKLVTFDYKLLREAKTKGMLYLTD